MVRPSWFHQWSNNDEDIHLQSEFIELILASWSINIHTDFTAVCISSIIRWLWSLNRHVSSIVKNDPVRDSLGSFKGRISFIID